MRGWVFIEFLPNQDESDQASLTELTDEPKRESQVTADPTQGVSQAAQDEVSSEKSCHQGRYRTAGGGCGEGTAK